MDRMARDAGCSHRSEDFLSQVRRLVIQRCRRTVQGAAAPEILRLLQPGKMLRTHLAGRLVAEGAPVPPPSAVACAAAVELVHTASLCHDDVIDGGLIRRAAPAVWRQAGPVAAILLGDILLAESVDLLAAEAPAYVRPFLAAVREMCAAEARSELLRGRSLTPAACLELAEGKTGALFGFVAFACGGADDELSAALASAGRVLGTAYQLTDDLLDVLGAGDACGKTLGSDAARGKCTLAQAPDGPEAVRRTIRRLRAEAVRVLHPWPPLRRAVAEFSRRDLERTWQTAGLYEHLVSQPPSPAGAS
jgi:heptaprenyl diphosphate synthase